MPLDRTAFFMGSHSEAEKRAQGKDMSLEERFIWANRTIKAAFGYNPDKPLKLDRTAFSVRKHSIA